MLTCLALVLAVGAAELPSLAAEVEAEARSLTARTEISPELFAGIEEFSTDAESLSASLRQLGVEADLPCIFHGISEDARVRATELQAAATPAEREAAFTNLRVLLDDAILIAPMAAAAAAERRENPD
ncbi:MAG: hypothetical protein JNL81_14570 [Hyphomonadaceae bacterium]|nr:hypothetical protein [Hyphomonadaceae bacterium]